MPNLPGTAALAALGAARSGATLRQGRPVGRLDRGRDAVALLRAVREAVPRARWSWPRAYADAAARAARAARARSCCRAWRLRPGVGVCLLDTAVKDGRGLLRMARARTRSRRWWPRLTPRAWRWRWPAPCAPRTCRWCATAGADIAGVRSAACVDGRALRPARRRRVSAPCSRRARPERFACPWSSRVRAAPRAAPGCARRSPTSRRRRAPAASAGARPRPRGRSAAARAVSSASAAPRAATARTGRRPL